MRIDCRRLGCSGSLTAPRPVLLSRLAFRRRAPHAASWGGQPVASALAATFGWERPLGHLKDQRLRWLPDAPVLKRQCVGHGSVADKIKQTRRSELVS